MVLQPRVATSVNRREIIEMELSVAQSRSPSHAEENAAVTILQHWFDTTIKWEI